MRHDSRSADVLDLRFARADQELQHAIDGLDDLQIVPNRRGFFVQALESRHLVWSETHREKCRHTVSAD